MIVFNTIKLSVVGFGFSCTTKGNLPQQQGKETQYFFFKFQNKYVRLALSSTAPPDGGFEYDYHDINIF